MKILLLTLFIFSSQAFAQLVPVELENFDDIELLDEFDESKEIMKIKEEPEKDEITKALDTIDEEDIDPELKDDDLQIKTSDLQNKYYTAENIEDNVLYEINLKKQEKIDELIKRKSETVLKSKTKYSKLELFKLRVKLEDIAKSKLVIMAIPRGSKLFNLRNDDVEYLTQDLTARVYSKTDADKFLYIIDKDGNLRYKVHHSLPTRIKRVTDLYKDPKTFTRLKKVKKVAFYDNEFDYTLRLGIHTGVTNTNFTKRIISDTAQYATLIRTEIGGISNIDFPFQFGFSGFYEAITGDLTDDGRFSTKTFSAGPSIMKKNLFLGYDFLIQPRLSFNSRLNESRSEEIIIHKLNETAMLFAVEKVNKTQAFGNITYGVNFQRKWIQPKAQSGPLDVGTSSRHDDSIAFFFGHRSNWIW